MKVTVLVAMALLLAGCGKGGTTADQHADAIAVAHGFAPPASERVAALPGQAQTTPLRAYIGHYPKDAVDGVSFYDRTEVALAFNEAVGDAVVRRMVRANAGPQTPIFAQDQRIAAWSCEPHDCEAHNWAFLLDPKTGKGELCYHDASAAMQTRVYAGGAPKSRSEACPSGDQPPMMPDGGGNHA